MDFNEVVKGRYACKKYDGRPVDPAKLTAILEAGRLAPTAKNLQEQRIYVAQSAEALQKVDKVTPCRYGAATVLVIAFDKNNVFTYPGGERNTGAEDISIVATHIMLAAKANGVESCWINLIDPAEVAKEFNLPENEEVVLLMDLGYPAPEGKPLPNHSKRKDLSETVKYI